MQVGAPTGYAKVPEGHKRTCAKVPERLKCKLGLKIRSFFWRSFLRLKVMFVSPAFLVPVTTKGILTFKSIK